MEQTAITQQLHYRLFQEADLPGILKLWEEESGWGQLTAEKWHEWYANTPYGPCLVVVATNETGDVVAQAVFTPTQVVVGEQTLKALRLSAPILHRELRQKSLRQTNHPVIGLYFAGVEAAIQSGYSLVYSLPDYGWLPFFRWGYRVGLPQFHDAEYECFEFPIGEANSVNCIDGINNFVIRQVTSFSHQYDFFWEAIQQSSIQCCVVRKSDWLNYKYGANVTILEFFDQATDQLQAYVVIRQDGLLIDMLCHPDITIMSILSATLKWIIDAKNEHNLETIQFFKVMATPSLRSALEALQFKLVNFKFAFVCTSLSPSLGMDALTPGSWYVMPGD